MSYAYETIGTSGSKPEFPSNFTQSNFSRPTSFTFVSGDSFSYGYDDGGIGSAIKLNDRISRPSAVGDARYDYLGLQRISMVDFVTPDVQLNYHRASNGAETAGEYPGYDRFGRIARQLWTDGNFTTSSSASLPDRPAIVELAYEYDKVGNILAKIDARQGDHERDNQNMVFEYDGLHRLKTAFVGQTTVTTSNEGVDSYSMSSYASGLSERWDLSVLGNHLSVDTDTAGDGFQGQGGSPTWDSVESTFNASNEIKTISFDGGTTTPSFTYDDAGNLAEEVLDSSGTLRSYTHDAWNRLVEVIDDATGHPLARYEYNGLHWRVLKQLQTDSTPDIALDEERRMYYDANWRIVSEELDDDLANGTNDRKINYVWGLRGLDDLLYREVSTDLTNDPGAGGLTYEDTWYHLTDHQLSPVAIITDTGVVAERVRYDAYGRAHYFPEGDVNMDGTRDTADAQLIKSIVVGPSGSNQIGGTLYTAEADLNRDGVVNNSDFALWPSSGAMTEASLPAGSLSSSRVDNVIGYCGYVFNEETQDYTVRFRTYDPERGRWLERDPAGFVDGGNLYAYGPSSPLSGSDPMGLIWWGSGDPDTIDEDESPRQAGKKRGWGGKAPGTDDTLDPLGGGGANGAGTTRGPNSHKYGCNDRKTENERFIENAFRENRSPDGHTWASVKHGAVSLAHELAKEGVVLLIEEATGVIVLRMASKVLVTLVRRADGMYDAYKDGKKVADGVECFAAGTLVATPQGLVSIEEIEVGDLVLSLNEETGEVEAHRVDYVSERDAMVVELTIGHADGQVETIRVTLSHYVLTVDGDWIQVGSLELGTQIHTLEGDVAAVLQVGTEPEWVAVYNLEVAVQESFFVGQSGICVHNAGPELPCGDYIDEVVQLTVHGARRVKWVDPSTVRFTHDSVSPTFSTGEDVFDVIRKLKNGDKLPDEFPPIRIHLRDGKWYTLDNRRLYVMKEAGVSKIKTVVATAEEVAKEWDSKFTTENDGCSVRVRSGPRRRRGRR